jgi:hypothetical protein
MTSGVWSSDSQSGFRALSAHALDCLHFSQSGFSIESEMQFLARDHHLRVLEAPIKVTYAEPAKRNPVRHASQVMNGILKLVGQSRPLLFFSSLGIIMLVASAFLGVSQINIYLQSRMLQPEFIALAILLTTSGIIMVFAGVILHSIRAWFINLQQLLLSQSNRQSNNADSTVF